MLPKLRFLISANKDVKTFQAFGADAVFDDGQSFRWAVLKPYPCFRKNWQAGKIKIKKTEIADFVRRQYRRHKSVMSKNLALYRQDWHKLSSEFFTLSAQLFPNTPWPAGKYICYPTIWGMYPRFLEDKTFQVPYKHPRRKFVQAVIGHEMLHFIFYKYFYRKFPRYRKHQYDMLSWHVSEVFNTVIAQTAIWQKIFGTKSKPYPEHRAIIARLNSKYSNSIKVNSDTLIRDIIRAVKQAGL